MPNGHGGAQATQHDRAALELWGGIEPTHNRVGDRYYSQLDRSGHHARLTDLDLRGYGYRWIRLRRNT